MENNFFVKRADFEDLKFMEEIERKSIPDSWSLTAFEDTFKQKTSEFFVAKNSDGEILGYITAIKIIDELEICNIAVAENSRRKGVAAKLLSELFSVNSDVKYSTLEVRESNLGAIKLYENFGYKKVSVRKNYYKNPNENGIIMVRNNL